jgi:glycosyltransferase involved in cell wall biosynthesis
MKVLSVAHNAVASSNRRRQIELGRLPDVSLTLLTPPWWFEEGRRIEAPRPADWRVGRTLGTGNGTRHVYMSALWGLIRSLQPDVIDLVEEPFAFVALQALVGRELFARSAALVVYSAVNVRREWRLPYRAIERLVLRRVDGAHAPSNEVGPILRAKGLLDQPVATIPLGVDAERFALAQPLTFERASRPRIGFVGRLEPVKGLDVLLDAFEHLPQSWSLVVAGDGPERGRVQARADGERVRLLSPLAYADVPGFLRSLDVLVLPSVTILPQHREQFGRVLVEAMAAGVPVIGSSSGAIPETIGDAGLVVPERDADALASAIRRLVSDRQLRDSLVERGRRRVAERFAWPVVAAQTLDLFHAALAHRRSRVGALQGARA